MLYSMFFYDIGINSMSHLSSVTRLGDLLDFGQLFKVCGNNWFAQITHIFRRFL